MRGLRAERSKLVIYKGQFHKGRARGLLVDCLGFATRASLGESSVSVDHADITEGSWL